MHWIHRTYKRHSLAISIWYTALYPLDLRVLAAIAQYLRIYHITGPEKVKMQSMLSIEPVSLAHHHKVEKKNHKSSQILYFPEKT